MTGTIPRVSEEARKLSNTPADSPRKSELGLVMQDFNPSYIGGSGRTLTSSSPTILLLLGVKKRKLAKMYFRM